MFYENKFHTLKAHISSNVSFVFIYNVNMELFYRKIGRGRPLIILHGLYGMSDNWLTVARMLSDTFTLWIPDLRNHGRSPKSEIHTYEAMAADVYEFINTQRIENPIIIGHSMGGKVVMKLVDQYSGIAEKICIVDIAPVNYSAFSTFEIKQHEHIIDSLLKLDVTKIVKRQDADTMLSEYIREDKLRAFLLKNLHRKEDKVFEWLINLPVLKTSLSLIINGFDDWENKIINTISAYFIKGEHSSYIRSDFEPIIRKIFPNNVIVSVPNSGHWVHADNSEFFVRILKNWFA